MNTAGLQVQRLDYAGVYQKSRIAQISPISAAGGSRSVDNPGEVGSMFFEAGVVLPETNAQFYLSKLILNVCLKLTGRREETIGLCPH